MLNVKALRGSFRIVAGTKRRVLSNSLVIGLALFTVCRSIYGQSTNATDTIEFSAANYTVAESESTPTDITAGFSPRAAEVTVIRYGELLEPLLVDLVVTNGTALYGTHYSLPGDTNQVTSITNTIRFAPLQIMTNVLFTIIDNTNETPNLSLFRVLLQNPRPAPDADPDFVVAELGRRTNSTVTIQNDDVGATFTHAIHATMEGVSNSVVIVDVVIRNNATNEFDTSIQWATEDTNFTARAGSSFATAGQDFVPDGGTLVIPAGTTGGQITIPILADSLMEFNEDFRIILTNVMPVTVTNTITTTNMDETTTTTEEVSEVTLVQLGRIRATKVTIINNPVSSDPVAGSVDPTFNPFRLANPLPGANNAVYDIALQPDGKILIGGEFSAVNAIVRPRIARINAGGGTNFVDLTFDAGRGPDGFVNSIAVQQFGTNSLAVIGGGFTSVNGIQRNGIARLLENGSVDPSFNPGAGANGPVYAVASTGDNEILIGGDFTAVGGVPRNRIARLTPDGTVDLTFDPGPGPDGPVFAIDVHDAPSQIQLNVAESGDGPGEHRTNVNAFALSGSVDLTYQFLATTNVLNVYQGTNLLFSSGVVTNQFTTSTNIDGTVLTNFIPANASFTFGPGSTTVLDFVLGEGNTNTVNREWSYQATIRPDIQQGILIGGDFTTFAGQDQRFFARLSPDGSLDQAFGTGQGADGPVYAIDLLLNGQIYVGGSFGSIDSIPRGSIARLNEDGSVDPSFDPGDGVFGSVFALAEQADGRVLIGGVFNSVNHTVRSSIARLLPDGTVDTTFLDTSFNMFAGLADPNGYVSAIALEDNGDVLIGGLFGLLGGGADRSSTTVQNNFAELVGGEAPGPGSIQFESPVFSYDENIGRSGSVATVWVTRTNGVEGTIEVEVSTRSGSATADEDFVPVDVIGTFDPGFLLSAPLPIELIDDDQAEGNESFQTEITGVSGWLDLGGVRVPTAPAIARRVAEVTIVDNDFAVAGAVGFSLDNYFVDETGLATIEVVRTGGSAGTITVDFSARGVSESDGATAGSDFIARTGTLTFTPGQTNRTFTIGILDDTQVEFDERITLTLSNVRGGTIDRSRATLTVIDNDRQEGRLTFTAANYAVTEDAHFVTVSVQRRGGNVGLLTVDYTTSDGTASAPFDYAGTSGRLVWNHGDISTKSFTVDIRNDGLVEAPETINLLLSNPNVEGALGLVSTATITIEDDDRFGELAFESANYFANENGGSANIIVTRRNGSAESVQVDYEVQMFGTTAAIGKDYEPVSGTLLFGVGETSKSFSVPILNDEEADGEKSIVFALKNPVSGSLGSLTNTVLTIVDDESLNVPAGSLDSEFRVGSGPNAPVSTLALQADGKILIAGEFTQYNQQIRSRIARLGPSGTLDPTFKSSVSANDNIRSVHVQEDGRILIGGSFTSVNGTLQNRIARLSADGSLDSTFNPGAGADNTVNVVLERRVGEERKILVGGTFSTIRGQASPNIAQLNLDGSVDLSFDPGTGPNGTVYDLVPLRDGKILIAGDFKMVNGIARNFIARLNQDGSLDTTFDAGLGADGSVRTIAIQADDKIIIGGMFNSVSGVQRNGVARLNPDGTLDSSFDPDGGANDAVLAAEVQTDGKILLAGSFTEFAGIDRNRIARLNTDGSIDTTINFGLGANGTITSLAIQGDRKLVIGGNFTLFDGVASSYLARLHGGSVAGSGTVQFSQAVFEVNENTTNAVVTVKRLGGTSGDISADFATSGRTAESFIDYQEVVGTLEFKAGETAKSIVVPIIDDALPEEDEIVDLSLTNPTGGAELGRQPIATLNIISDDSVLSFSDPAYSVTENAIGQRAVITVRRTGKSTGTVTVNYSASSGTAQAGSDFSPANGTLVFAAGVTVQTFVVMIVDDNLVEENETVNLQLNSPTGGGVLGQATASLTIIDNDFAPGIISLASINAVNESARTATVTVTRTSGRSGEVTVDFATENGTATQDEDYRAASGTLRFADGETSRSITIPILDDSLVEGNETVIIALSNPTGGAILGGNSIRTLTILDDDFGPGSLDSTFNPGSGANGSVFSIAVQPDEKILIGGEFTTFNGTFRNHIARLQSNGSVDPTFAPGEGPDGDVFTVHPLNDGRIMIGGAFRTVASVGRGWVARLTTNGFPDFTFSASAGLNGPVFDLVPQADGKTIVGGQFTSPARGIARVNANGSSDISFVTEGGADGPVLALALQADNRVIFGGSFTNVAGTSRGSIARLNPNGLLDSSFATGSGANGAVFAIALAANGKILIGGDFTMVHGVSRNGIARLNADGSLDVTFAPGTGVQGGPVYAIALQLDGKAFIAGDFSSVAGVARTRVARLNVDGTLDETFDAGRGPNGPVYSIAVQADQNLLIGGDFSSVNGFARNGIARLNGDPELPRLEVRIETVTRNESGDVSLSFTSLPGRTYVIEASSNLSTWDEIGSVNATGSVSTFTDRSAATETVRFYRIRDF